jgi:hypothetical protein
MEIPRLAWHWRGLAKFTDVAKAEVLRKCADEVERAWHDHAHDGARETDGSCRICDAEMRAEELGPPEPNGA